MNQQHIPAIAARPILGGNQEMQLTALRIAATIETLTTRGFTVMSIEHTGGSAPTIQIQSCPACAAMIDRGEAVYYCVQGDGATRARKGQFKIDSVRVIWFERGH